MNIQYYAADGTVKNLGDDELQHWKYIKKIKTGSGWRYFYTPEELRQFYNEGKKKADSIPRLQKHGEKYYIADKKTQRRIEKSGAGGNTYYRRKDGTNEFTTAGRAKGRVEIYKDSARRNADELKYNKQRKKMGLSITKGDQDTVTPAIRVARDMAKSKAYEGAAKGITKKYEKYEAKNVLTKPFSSVKNKLKKKNKGKKKTQENYKVTMRVIKEELTPISEVTLKNGTTIKYNTNKKRKKSK